MATSIKDIATGRIFSGDNDKAAEDYLDQVIRGWDGVTPPDFSGVELDRFQSAGEIDPSIIDAGAPVQFDEIDPVLAETFRQGDSELKNISVDPRLRDAQMAALDSLTELGQSGGMTAQDKANLARIQSQTAQADRGRREAILQNMNARGMGGSGMELLAQLQSSQAATDRAAQEGLDVAGMAQQRALEALAESGRLGGSIRGQDFGEQAQVATAQDAINRFNTANSIQNSQFNAGVRNQTNQFNTSGQFDANKFNRSTALDASKAKASILTGNRDNRQGVLDKNTVVSNQEKVDLPQKSFDNKVTVAQGKTQGAKAGLDYYKGESDKDRDAWGNILSGGAQVAAVMMSDERKKKNIMDLDKKKVSDFLKTFSPKKFQYKDSQNGQGDFVGPMAQDLQKSDLGSTAVVQAPDGTLGYDRDKMMGIHSAALKFLSEQLDSIKKGKS